MIRFCQTHSVHRGGYVTVGICCWQITYSKDQSQGAKPMNLCITTSFISTTLDVAGCGEMRCLAKICTLRVLFSSFLFFFFKTAFTTNNRKQNRWGHGEIGRHKGTKSHFWSKKGTNFPLNKNGNHSWPADTKTMGSAMLETTPDAWKITGSLSLTSLCT